MKSLVITAPDEIFDQTVEALCQRQGDGIPVDGETRLEIAKEQLIVVLGDIVREHARTLIRETAQAKIEAEVKAAHNSIAATREFIEVKIG